MVEKTQIELLGECYDIGIRDFMQRHIGNHPKTVKDIIVIFVEEGDIIDASWGNSTNKEVIDYLNSLIKAIGGENEHPQLDRISGISERTDSDTHCPETCKRT